MGWLNDIKLLLKSPPWWAWNLSRTVVSLDQWLEQTACWWKVFIPVVHFSLWQTAIIFKLLANLLNVKSCCEHSSIVIPVSIQISWWMLGEDIFLSGTWSGVCLVRFSLFIISLTEGGPCPRRLAHGMFYALACPFMQLFILKQVRYLAQG